VAQHIGPLRHAFGSSAYDEENALCRFIAWSRRPLWRTRAAWTSPHQTEGCVPVAPRLRVAVHWSRAGQRYLAPVLLGSFAYWSLARLVVVK